MGGWGIEELEPPEGWQVFVDRDGFERERRRPCRYARKILRLSRWGDRGIGLAPPTGAEVGR